MKHTRDVMKVPLCWYGLSAALRLRRGVYWPDIEKIWPGGMLRSWALFYLVTLLHMGGIFVPRKIYGKQQPFIDEWEHNGGYFRISKEQAELIYAAPAVQHERLLVKAC